MSQTGSSDNKYQYAGEQLDATLGDYYLRQRFYDTSSGRFGRMDTFEGDLNIPLSLNKYIYAHSNPVTLTDPSGYSVLSWFFADYSTMFAISAVTLYSVYTASRATIDVSFALSSAITEAMITISKSAEEAVGAAASALSMVRKATEEELKRRRNELNQWQVIIQMPTGLQRIAEKRFVPALGSKSPIVEQYEGDSMRLLGTRLYRKDGNANILIARADYHPLKEYKEPFTVHYHLGPTDNGGHYVLWPEQTFIPH